MKWNLKRISAIAAIIVLLGFAAAALIFAFIDAPWAQEALSASLFCAITVPVFIYLMMLVAKVLRGRGVNSDKKTDLDQPQAKNSSKK